jgi:hypothetical protein
MFEHHADTEDLNGTQAILDFFRDYFGDFEIIHHNVGQLMSTEHIIDALEHVVRSSYVRRTVDEARALSEPGKSCGIGRTYEFEVNGHNGTQVYNMSLFLAIGREGCKGLGMLRCSKDTAAGTLDQDVVRFENIPPPRYP